MKRALGIIRTLVFLSLLGGLGYGGYYYYTHYYSTQQSGALTASGTVEATEVNLGSQLGGRVEAMDAAEGDPVTNGEILAEVRPTSGVVAKEEIRSYLDGVVLDRLFEPGELVSPGGTLYTVGNLYSLTLTVYVPEDRYGQITLGHTYPVTVDSFPGRVFAGKVTHIADQAEFTPRNVQTVEGRKNTVFAIKLTLENPDLALKPGMPADVNFSASVQ
jgi:multidrug efflux pump subunit AcrA (membrane-fusion protein)